MNRARERALCGTVAVLTALSACGGGAPPPPTVTTVGKSVSTLQKTFTLTGCTEGDTPRALPVEPQDWWNAMPAANHQYPFVGWEAFQAGVGGCAQTRVDTYRAVATFNLTAVNNLKGLVTNAMLVLETRALPSGLGPTGETTTLNAGPLGVPGSVNLFCSAHMGGLGGLMRFGPNAAVPTTSPAGDFELLGANPLPAGSGTVYTLPTTLASGAVAGATSPTTASLSGDGGSVFSTDVTGAVTAALNANAAGISWMAISNWESHLPGVLTAAVSRDCRTSVSFDLKITHR